MVNKGTRDIGGMVCCALFILVGVVAIYETTTMIDADSFVFPRTVAIAMIVFSLIYIVWNLMRPPAVVGVSLESQAVELGGSTPRRISLVLAMLGSALIMPWVGFYIAGMFAFASMMTVAMYDRWTRFRLIVYPLILLAVVSGFHLLFGQVLKVPLPEAPFF